MFALTAGLLMACVMSDARDDDYTKHPVPVSGYVVTPTESGYDIELNLDRAPKGDLETQFVKVISDVLWDDLKELFSKENAARLSADKDQKRWKRTITLPKISVREVRREQLGAAAGPKMVRRWSITTTERLTSDDQIRKLLDCLQFVARTVDTKSPRDTVYDDLTKIAPKEEVRNKEKVFRYEIVERKKP